MSIDWPRTVHRTSLSPVDRACAVEAPPRRRRTNWLTRITGAALLALIAYLVIRKGV